MDIIKKYFPNFTDHQLDQFNQLEVLFRDWNSKINLVSRKDIENLHINHFLHSLSIAKFIEFVPNTDVLDVGTGGGFPGIPLAIAFPEVNFHLVDSIRKKVNVVQNIVEELKLENVKTSWLRADKVPGKYDFVVSRAVSTMPVLAGWTKSKIKSTHRNALNNGLILLKGGDLINELKDFKRAVTIELSDYIDEDFFSTKKLVFIDF